MDFQALVILIILLMLVIAVSKRLLYLALIVLVLGVAYYTGAIEAAWNIISPYLESLIPSLPADTAPATGLISMHTFF